MKSCHVMMKNSSPLCHLHCKSCFCINNTEHSPECNTYCMDGTTLQLFIRRKIDTEEASDVVFTWQDGESMPGGLHFFERVIELQQQYAQSKNIINTFQTNGILLDDEWCEFFKKNKFMICISVDSDVALYDNACDTISGKSTNYQVENAARLLQKYDIEFSTLTVVNTENSHHPLRIYHYLKSLGSRHMQFIPLLRPLVQGGVDAQSLGPAALGIFLKTIFYTWIRLDIGTIKIPIFEHAFAAWCELSVPTCVYASCDDSALALKINDDNYHCDRVVNSKYFMRDCNQPIATAMQQNSMNQRVESSKPTLAEECASCKVEFVCHGGCAKDRVALSRCGVPQLNYFCESYQAFFTYVEPYMLMMRALWEQNYAPSDIRQYLT